MSNKSKEVLELEYKIRSPKYDNLRVVALLFLHKTPEELEVIRNRVSPLFKGLLSMSYLKRAKIEDVYKSGYYLDKETYMLYGIFLYLFKYHQQFINQYVTLRDRAYDLFLTGKYEEALAIVADIDKKCCSFWSERFKMAIYKTMQDDDKFQKYYNDLLNKNLSAKLSYLIRRANSSQKFNLEDNNASEKSSYDFLTTAIDNVQLRDFYLSYCCPFKELETDNWVGVSLNSSLIDIYECMLDNLRRLSKSTRNNDQFREYIRQINNIIDDNMLQRWCYLEHIGTRCPQLNSVNIELQKLYVSEDYQATWEKGIEYINKNPRDIPIQLMVAKSIVYKGNTDEIAVDDGMKPLSDILFMNQVVMFDKDKTKVNAINSLLGACYSLNFILELRCLYIYVVNYKSIFMHHVLDDFWKYSPSLSIYDLGKYVNDHDRREYIDKWSLQCNISNSDASAYIQSLNTSEMMPMQLNVDISNKINHLKENLHNELIPSYWESGIASCIYNYYLSSNQLEEALEFYVNNTISDKLISIERQQETQDLISENYDLLEEYPLEMSIFRTMTEMPDDDRFDAYLTYLEKMGKKRASELEVTSDNRKILYFLSYVCDFSVLWQHVDVLKSSNQVYEERIKICKKLLEIQKNKRISDEISEIIQQQKIKSLTRKVDESKIYVDVSAICKKEIETERTLFDIYLNFDMLNDHHREVITDSNEEKSNGIDSKEAEEIKQSLFARLFLSIRDKFLFDQKYGLDFFLSTRIRHGTLMNQLRHSFESYHLVTNKNADDIYADDQYWSEEIFNLEYAEQQKVKSLIGCFSAKIDDGIIHLKDNCIQIKTEKKKEKDEAAFDFCYVRLKEVIERCCEDCSGITDFSEIVSLIISKLWNHTSECLDVARRTLLDYTQMCIQALDQLDSDVCSVFPNYRKSDFHNIVMNCKTAVTNDVDVVKGWFQLKNTADFDFNIKDVYDTSLAFVNNVHQNPLIIAPQIHSYTQFRQRSHFIALYDIFSDMFNNTCNYASRRTHRDNPLECLMNISEEGQSLTVEFSNMVDVEDEPKILEDIEERKANESKYIETGLSRSVKKTGIVRMMILTKSALGDNNNELDVKLENHRFVVSAKFNMTPLVEI